MADYNIALGVKPPEPVNYLGQMAQVMAIKAAQDEMEGSEGARAAIRGGMSPTDPRLLEHGRRGEAIYKAGLAGEKETLAAAASRRTLVGQIMKNVADAGTFDAVQQGVSQLVREGVMPSDRAQYYLDQARNATPDQIRAFAMGEYKAALSPKDLLPKTEMRDLGGTVGAYTIDPVTGAVGKTFTENKTQSPDSIASTAAAMYGHNVTAQGQKLTDARERERGVQVTGAENPMIVSPFTGVAKPIMAANPAYAPPPPVSPSNALLNAANPPANALMGGGAPTVANAAAQPPMIPVKAKPPIPMFEQSYDRYVGENTGKGDIALIDAAKAAPANIAKLDEITKYINKADVTTGFGADLIKNINRARAQFTADAKAGKAATDTEILDAMLGAGVFPMIQSLGIGARGMDTPAEREFLRGVMTGTISMNKETLNKLTQIRRDIEVRSVDKYHQALDRGELDPYAKAARRKLDKIEIPAAPSAGAKAAPNLTGEDKAALDWANANPGSPDAARIKAHLGVQ